MLLEAVTSTAADNRYVGNWDYSFSVMNSVLVYSAQTITKLQDLIGLQQVSILHRVTVLIGARHVT